MSATAQHPWIQSLHAKLDGLEKALLDGDAVAVAAASTQVQQVLQQAPRTADFMQLDHDDLRSALPEAAQRFGQLRQAVVRAHAQSQRAVQSLVPHAPAMGTYGPSGSAPGTGAGKAYLSA